MTEVNSTFLRNYFIATLPFVNEKKLLNLLDSLEYEYKGTATADDCMKCFTQFGKAFYQEYANLADEAINSNKYKAYMKALKNGYKLAHATGELTNEQKVTIAESALSTFTDSLKSIGDMVNKDANAANAQANLLNAQNQANKQEEKSTTKTLLIAGGVILAVVLAVVLIVVLKKK